MKSYLLLSLLFLAFFISNCASNKNQEVEPRPEIQPPTAVGSILTKLEVLEYKSYDLPENQIRARVVEVLAYGANTQILKIDSELTLSFTDSEAFSSLNEIEEGEIFEAVISKSVPSLNSTGSNSSWKIVELKK